MAKDTTVMIQKVPLNKIKLGKNSRMSVSPEELDGLMNSIKEVGLLQPIGVVRRQGYFEIAYGNRRFLAVSKLGLSHIPAVVHDVKKESDVDLKNLTENVQRRNLSLAEVGRYCELLRKEKLSAAEIAVRLGVSKHYVMSCVQSFQNVPAEFREDLEVQHANQKKTPGKISIGTATAIVNASKTLNLSRANQSRLYKAAKSDDRFIGTDVPKYAKALDLGHKNFLDKVKKTHMVNLQIHLTEAEHDSLYAKYVGSGPFASIAALMRAVLKGEKSVKIGVLN